MNEQILCELNGQVTPEEIIAVRENPSGDEELWQRCLRESLCVVTARDRVSNQLLGVGFLVGNSRHASIVDLSVHSTVRKNGIGGRMVDELVSFAKNKGIRYFGLTYDKGSPWLKRFYERHGFQSIDFAMWEKDSLAGFNQGT